jgi:pimeloyl-ACP methyl ester carboxylesterase
MRMTIARLTPVAVPDRPDGAVLVLHGGASRRDGIAVSPAQLSVLRMIPIAARIARAGRDRLAVFRLLNSTRGWDSHHTPAADVAWALDQLAERFGGPPATCLVGHSLGGRAALLSAGRPEVRSVVALAPWVYADDVHGSLVNRPRILIVHGDRDRIAKPERSAELARRLAEITPVSYVTVRGGKHAMLGRGAVFERLATQFAIATLLGDPAEGPIERALAGEPWLEV